MSTPQASGFDLRSVQQAVEAIRSAVDANNARYSRGRIRRAADPALRPAVDPPTLQVRAGEAGRDLSVTLLVPARLDGYLRRDA